jgi:hypothetical protein
MSKTPANTSRKQDKSNPPQVAASYKNDDYDRHLVFDHVVSVENADRRVIHSLRIVVS